MAPLKSETEPFRILCPKPTARQFATPRGKGTVSVNERISKIYNGKLMLREGSELDVTYHIDEGSSRHNRFSIYYMFRKIGEGLRIHLQQQRISGIDGGGLARTINP